MKTYQQTLAPATTGRQEGDLLLFHKFLFWEGYTNNPPPEPIERRRPITPYYSNIEYWGPITFGTVEHFKNWQLKKGYAIASINIRLSTVRLYAKFAYENEIISADQYLRIKNISSVSTHPRRNPDRNRTTTRKGHKKAKDDWTRLTDPQVRQLKSLHQQSPRGLRDALIICLLADHGMRPSALASMQWAGIDFDTRILTFYEIKTMVTIRHKMTNDSYAALSAYAGIFGYRKPLHLLVTSTKRLDGKLKRDPLRTRGIYDIVRKTGQKIGVESLSANDLRHNAITRACENGLTDQQINYMFGHTANSSMAAEYRASIDIVSPPDVNQITK